MRGEERRRTRTSCGRHEPLRAAQSRLLAFIQATEAARQLLQVETLWQRRLLEAELPPHGGRGAHKLRPPLIHPAKRHAAAQRHQLQGGECFLAVGADQSQHQVEAQGVQPRAVPHQAAQPRSSASAIFALSCNAWARYPSSVLPGRRARPAARIVCMAVRARHCAFDWIARARELALPLA